MNGQDAEGNFKSFGYIKKRKADIVGISALVSHPSHSINNAIIFFVFYVLTHHSPCGKVDIWSVLPSSRNNHCFIGGMSENNESDNKNIVNYDSQN